MKWNKVALVGPMRTVKMLPNWAYTQNKTVLLERNLAVIAATPRYKRLLTERSKA